MNVVDRLIENTIRTKNPTVVGLDPDIRRIPACYKQQSEAIVHPLQAVADAIYAWNRDVIDTVAPLVPAVKPQMAFYEKYGSYGVATFEKTVAYARSKGLVVIEDAKRNDIGNTAQAYADGHLGTVGVLDGTAIPSLDVDFLTVSPFLGSEGLDPFMDTCMKYSKGIFVLVKTSNTSAGELQDVVTADGLTVSRTVARYVAKKAETFTGARGYSPIGAVVGATYSEDAVILRRMMPKSYFLVPGYGVQGGGAQDVLPCFQPDGLGAVVNSSRGILYTHMTDAERMECSREAYLKCVRNAVVTMRNGLYEALRCQYPHMIY